MRLRTLSVASFFLLWLLPWSKANGDVPATVPPLPDLSGPRTLAMASTIATASGNDGIFVNPGAIAARRVYSLELSGLIDRRGADDFGSVVTGSILDGISAPVTTGVAWAQVFKGVFKGAVADLGFAGQASKGLYLGLTGKWLKLEGPSQTANEVTVDAGALCQLGQYVSIGGAGYNLVPVNSTVAPRGAGAGLAVGTESFLLVTAEWKGDFLAAKTESRYAAGAEALIAQEFPLRVGLARDQALNATFWSLGAGMAQPTWTLDAGYRQAIGDPTTRTFAASLKIYFVP